MTLSKDRLIQIALAVIIVVLVGITFTSSKTDKSEESLTDEEVATEESEGDEQEDVAAAPTKTTTPTATASTKTTTPKPPTSGGCYPGLSAKKSEIPKGILLYWTTCTSDDFQFYKLVKSSLNSSPSYPSDPVAMSSSNRSAASFVDKTVAPSTTYYYRVCVVQRLNKVTCGNVASVTY